MGSRPLSAAVHTALTAYTTGGAVALAELAYDAARDRQLFAEDRRDTERRAHEGAIVTAVRRRLGLDSVGVPHVQVRTLINHRDKSSRALVEVHVPMRGGDAVYSTWLSGGDETMEAWLGRVAEACRVLCPARPAGGARG